MHIQGSKQYVNLALQLIQYPENWMNLHLRLAAIQQKFYLINLFIMLLDFKHTLPGLESFKNSVTIIYIPDS